MAAEPSKDSPVSAGLQTAIADIQASHGLLLSDELDPRVLTEFRDVLNRVRNVAWAAQQSVAARISGEDPSAVGSLLAAERIRAAYQLCRLIQEDLTKNEIDFQKGQLSELYAVTKELAKQLKSRV
jgi:spore coat polysaccharide biosynthesis protein SpsF (cytidylyltransferase family)